MNTKIATVTLIFLLLAGCQSNKQSVGARELSEAFKKDNIVPSADAEKLGTLADQSITTGQLSSVDIDRTLNLLDGCHSYDGACQKKLVYMVSIIGELKPNSLTKQQREKLYEIGSKVVAGSQPDNSMGVIGGLKLIAKSEDRRGVEIAERWLQQGDESVKTQARETIIELSGE